MGELHLDDPLFAHLSTISVMTTNSPVPKLITLHLPNLFAIKYQEINNNSRIRIISLFKYMQCFNFAPDITHIFCKEKSILSMFNQFIPGNTIIATFDSFIDLCSLVMNIIKSRYICQNSVTAPENFTPVLQTGITSIKLPSIDQWIND